MESHVSTLALADYIQTRTGIYDEILSRFMREYFGRGSTPSRIDDRLAKDWVDSRGASSYIMDDDPPNEVHENRSRKHRRRRHGLSDDNMKKYQYF